MDPRNVGERIESMRGLDTLVQPLHHAVATVLPRGPVKDFLHGVWLGHPLHPLLTDLPIGFWTSSAVLDVVGGRKGQPAADTLVGLGVASAIPTVAAGLADWSELFQPERRSGAVHAVFNVAATTLYGLSMVARRRGARRRGVVLAMAGAAAATAGGYLGGHLSYRRAAGVNQAAGAAAPSDWTEARAEVPTRDGDVGVGEVDGTPIVTVLTETGAHALADRCSHLGGPLHEGELTDGCMRCPWHGSTFRVVDGTVVKGPATSPQPCYDMRTMRGRTEVRRKPARRCALRRYRRTMRRTPR